MKLTELGIKALEKKNVPNSKRITFTSEIISSEIETVEDFLDSGFIFSRGNTNRTRIVPNWERDFLRSTYMGPKTLVFLKSLLNENGYPVV